jgi:uncharacterized membrane protein HdeD (DUF308 family)
MGLVHRGKRSQPVGMSATIAPISALTPLRSNWGWLLGLGLLFLALGLIGMGRTLLFTVGTAVFFGVLILMGGAAQLVEAFKCTGWKSVTWHVLIAFLYLLAGTSIILDPLIASIVWTAIIAGTLVVVGIFKLVIALSHREAVGWFGLLLSGLISLALGVMLFVQWPTSGVWFLGLLVAIELLMQGIALVVLALSARTA